MKKAVRGQTMTEYSIIAALVCIAGIGGLMLFGQSLQQALMASSNSSPPPQAAVAPVVANPSVPQTAGNITGMQSNVQSGQSSVSLQLQSGQQLSLNNYTANSGNVLDVSGASGATTQMADTVILLANDLLQMGEINQEQANAMLALANQGHVIGNIEKAVEDAAAISSDGMNFKNQKVVVNGNSYTIDQLSTQIGWMGTAPDDEGSYLTHKDAWPEQEKFITLYDQVVNSGAVNDPAVKKVVENLVSQIGIISEKSEAVYYGAVYSDNLSEIKALASDLSKDTHLNSANICNSGKGKDTGVNCL